MAHSRASSGKRTPTKECVTKELTGSQQRVEFMKAVRKFDSNELKQLLRNSSLVNIRFRSGLTALMQVAEKGNSECVSILLKAGADVNLKDFGQKTALMYAAESANEKCASLLLGAEADVNACDKLGETALFRAVSCGNVECVKLLCESGADVNKTNNANNTPLMFAAMYRHVGCFRLLIAFGADVNKKNANGETVLMVSVNKRNLLRYGKSVTKKYIKKSKQNLECARTVIDMGADVNAMDAYERSPLFCAGLDGNVEAVRLLLRSNADVRLCDSFRVSWSWHFGGPQIVDAECMKLVYAAGKEINIPSDKEHLPIRLVEDKLGLRHMCRESIRKHLATNNPDCNLFNFVNQLPLPNALKSYLFYNLI